MDEPQKHAEWKNQMQKTTLLYDSVYMKLAVKAIGRDRVDW